MEQPGTLISGPSENITSNDYHHHEGDICQPLDFSSCCNDIRSPEQEECRQSQHAAHRATWTKQKTRIQEMHDAKVVRLTEFYEQLSESRQASYRMDVDTDLPLTSDLLRFYKARLHEAQENTQTELLDRLSILRSFLVEHHDATGRLETQLHELQHENTTLSAEMEETIQQRLEVIAVMKENEALKDKLKVYTEVPDTQDGHPSENERPPSVAELAESHVEAIQAHYEELIEQLTSKFHDSQTARETERTLSNANIDALNQRCKRLETVVSDSLQDIIRANTHRETLEERLKETEEELNVSVIDMQSQLEVFEKQMYSMSSMHIGGLENFKEKDGFDWQENILPDTIHASPKSFLALDVPDAEGSPVLRADDALRQALENAQKRADQLEKDLLEWKQKSEMATEEHSQQLSNKEESHAQALKQREEEHVKRLQSVSEEWEAKVAEQLQERDETHAQQILNKEESHAKALNQREEEHVTRLQSVSEEWEAKMAEQLEERDEKHALELAQTKEENTTQLKRKRDEWEAEMAEQLKNEERAIRAGFEEEFALKEVIIRREANEETSKQVKLAIAEATRDMHKKDGQIRLEVREEVERHEAQVREQMKSEALAREQELYAHMRSEAQEREKELLKELEAATHEKEQEGLQQLQAEIKAKELLIESIKKDLEVNSKALSELQEASKKTELDNTTYLQTLRSTHETELATVRRALTNIEALRNDFSQKLSSTQISLSNAVAHNNTLQDALRDLQDEIYNLKTSIDNLTTENATLQSSNDALTTRTNSLQTTVNDITSRNDTLQITNHDLSTRLHTSLQQLHDSEQVLRLKEASARKEQDAVMERTAVLVGDLNKRLDDMKSTNVFAQERVDSANLKLTRQVKAFDAFTRHKMDDESDLHILKQHIMKIERIALQYAPVEDAGLLNAIEELKKTHMATQMKHKKRRKKEMLITGVDW